MHQGRILAAFLLVILLCACAPVVATSPLPSLGSPSATPADLRTATPTLTPAPTLAPLSDFMKGLVYYPAPPGGNQRPETDWIMAHLAMPTGANWVRFPMACHQDDVKSTQVYCTDTETFSDEDYLRFVERAH